MIDQTDLEILRLLQANARTSNADIARQLDMAPSAIHQRIRKLENRGVIQGYSVRLSPHALDQRLLAFVLLRTVEPLRDSAVCEALMQIPEVLEVHDIAGEDCFLVKVRVRDPDHLHVLLRESIGQVPKTHSSKSIIVLKTFKESSDLPLPLRAGQPANQNQES